MSDPIDVGVVVVTYNSAGVIGVLLESLEAGLHGLDWRIVFIDNASSDGTAELVREAGYEVIVLDQNRGYAAGINRGIQRLGDVRSVLVLNPDVELMPESVAAMVGVLEDDRVGVVAAKTYLPGEQQTLERNQRRTPSLPRTWGTALLGGRISRHFATLSETVDDPRCYENERDVDWAVGAALLCSRRCLDTVGGWDEAYFLYSEETDFCHRARAAGFAVRYTPDAVVRHLGGDGFVTPRLRAMMAVNKVREYRRRNGWFASWLFFAGNVFHELTRAAAGRAASRSAAMALVSPRRRPAEIGASQSLMPG